MAQKSSARAKSPAARSNATSTTPSRSSSSIPKMPPSSSTTLEPQGFLQRAGKAVILACVAYAVVHLCTSYLESAVGGFVRIVFGMQFAAYVLAAAFMTESFYDMIGTSTFIAATIFAGYTGSWNLQQKTITTMVCLWGTRLGIFLIHRFHHAGVDRRFDKAKTDPFLFFVYWTMQGVWVTVTLLPVVLVLIQHAPSHSFTVVEFAGALCWLVGFAVESAADYQKTLFRSEASNSRAFINCGLWAYSRHPNYFGEIVTWTGVGIFCFPLLSDVASVSAVITPLFVFGLLNYVSGVPILEQDADKKWGGNKEYEKYKSSTRPLLLLPWRP